MKTVMQLIKPTLASMLLCSLFCCNGISTPTSLEHHKISPIKVKSVMLYDSIQNIPLDTLLTALAHINRVIRNIDDRPAGYSLWQVQSDTIPDYRYLIQGEWPDQATYDHIHQHPEFRKALDSHNDVISQTRMWKIYRRFELIN